MHNLISLYRQYYTEVQPMLAQLPATLYEWISDIVNERKSAFEGIHPILPDQVSIACLEPERHDAYCQH